MSCEKREDREGRGTCVCVQKGSDGEWKRQDRPRCVEDRRARGNADRRRKGCRQRTQRSCVINDVVNDNHVATRHVANNITPLWRLEGHADQCVECYMAFRNLFSQSSLFKTHLCRIIHAHFQLVTIAVADSLAVRACVGAIGGKPLFRQAKRIRILLAKDHCKLKTHPLCNQRGAAYCARTKKKEEKKGRLSHMQSEKRNVLPVEKRRAVTSVRELRHALDNSG